MNTCPRCLPHDPAFAADGDCPRCGEGLIAWPGRYQPRPEPLAEGGFARLFLASDAEGRVGVLKLSRAETSDRLGLALESLRQEADALARLPREEALPTLLERVEIAGEQGPIIGVVLSLLPGEPLGARLDAGVRPWALCHVVRQVASALDAALNAEGGPIHHLDLKPDNLLVGADPDRPEVGIIDFGSTKATSEGRGVTPAWAAPELRRVGRGELDDPEAADVWSLGLLLYTGMTGRHPVDPEAPAPEVPLPLPDLDRLPAPLRGLVARALSLDPAQRPRLAELAALSPDLARASGPRLRLADPARWRIATAEVDGLVALIVDGLLDPEAEERAFDAGDLAEALVPWLGQRFLADPDTRWTPPGWPGEGGARVAWGQDLVCALGLAEGGALSLLRHRPSGFSLPPDPESAEGAAWFSDLSVPDPDAAIDALLASPDEDWEEARKIPLQPGRLLVFPGLLFHRWERPPRDAAILRFSLSLAD